MCACPSVSEDSGSVMKMSLSQCGRQLSLEPLSVKKSLSIPRVRLMPGSGTLSTQASQTRDVDSSPVKFSIFKNSRTSTPKIAGSLRLSTPKKTFLGGTPQTKHEENHKPLFLGPKSAGNSRKAGFKFNFNPSQEVEVLKLSIFKLNNFEDLSRKYRPESPSKIPLKNYNIKEPSESFHSSWDSSDRMDKKAVEKDSQHSADSSKVVNLLNALVFRDPVDFHKQKSWQSSSLLNDSMQKSSTVLRVTSLPKPEKIRPRLGSREPEHRRVDDHKRSILLPSRFVSKEQPPSPLTPAVAKSEINPSVMLQQSGAPLEHQHPRLFIKSKKKRVTFDQNHLVYKYTAT